MKGSQSNYKKLIQKIGQLLDQGRDRAIRAVNSIMVRTYWELGRHIVEYEQKGNLKCFVLIDLKAGEIEHGDIGQMNMYLNYFAKEENTSDDSPPIGIVLGAHKDQILIEYATQNITNQLFVSKYQLYLPDKAKLESELYRLIA